MAGHYPIRASRPSWDVRLYSSHVCNNSCRYECIQILNDDMSVDLVLQRKPNLVDNRCPSSGKAVRSHVSLNTFDPTNPNCIDGPLLYSTEVIVPDTSVTIHLDHPLARPYEKVVTAPTPQGFRLVDLLTHIRDCYRHVYSEEERTAPAQTFQLTKPCIDCLVWKENKKVNPCSPKSGDECSICCAPMETGAARTRCGHVFHSNCLLEWMDEALTCPMCRAPLRNCVECNGTFIVRFEETAAERPRAYREILRNTTQGTHGIHSFYLDDLAIHALHYDRISKRLTVKSSI